MHSPKFFLSKHCNELLSVLHDAGKIPDCCGEPMEELRANTSDGATEKHLPVVEVSGQAVTVRVGSIYHPMSAEHNIGWVYLVTNQGFQHKVLPEDRDPVVSFALSAGEKAVEAYAYCNLHGLWKTGL